MEDTDYVLGRTSSEYERLIEQAELVAPITERMLRAAGMSAGMRVLDIGCGVGDVSFVVRDLVGLEGSVVGVDVDRDALEFAGERAAARGITNIEFRHGDFRSVAFEQSFDAAVGRFVLMYISDPTDALRRIAQRVRPGGIVAFLEHVAPVMVASALDLPVLAALWDLLSATFECSGASLNTGAELYWRMLDAGLEADPAPLAEFPVHIGRDAVAYRRWGLLARSMLPKIVEYGLATEEQVLDTIENLLHDELRAARAPVPLGCMFIGQWARKPAR